MNDDRAESASQEVWYRVADRGEVRDGSIKSAVAAGKPIVLVCVGGRYGALDARCPHAGGPLADGMLENGLLVCPWHGREYDPFDGRCEGYTPVAAHKVEVRSDGIYVAISD